MWEENGIIWSVYKPHLKITLDVAKKIVADRHLVSNGITRPIIVDIRNLTYADDTARKYLAGEEASRHISAGALIKRIPRSSASGWLLCSHN